MSVGSIQCRLLTLVSSRHAMCSPNTKACSAQATPFVWRSPRTLYSLRDRGELEAVGRGSTGSPPPRRSPAPTWSPSRCGYTRRHLPDLGAAHHGLTTQVRMPWMWRCPATHKSQARWHSATRILVLRSVLQLWHRCHLDRPGSRESVFAGEDDRGLLQVPKQDRARRRHRSPASLP